ncbi:MAG: hypothetical protein CMJ60_07170, partial [Planctomycetaceae bacterium]|nr:hypothetical protein [Planctomycetaceae bacterium]
MKNKSWHLNRREMLRAPGFALALPLLESMLQTKSALGDTTAGQAMPKRLVVSYFSYGAYMPNGANGIQDMEKPHDEWSWWPCKEEGNLTFNKNSAPFEPFKEQVSYL